MHAPGYSSDTYTDATLKKCNVLDKWTHFIYLWNVYNRQTNGVWKSTKKYIKEWNATKRGGGGKCPRYYRRFSCASLTPIISERDSKNGPQRVTPHWICIGAKHKKGGPRKGAILFILTHVTQMLTISEKYKKCGQIFQNSTSGKDHKFDFHRERDGIYGWDFSILPPYLFFSSFFLWELSWGVLWIKWIQTRNQHVQLTAWHRIKYL